MDRPAFSTALEPARYVVTCPNCGVIARQQSPTEVQELTQMHDCLEFTNQVKHKNIFEK